MCLKENFKFFQKKKCFSSTSATMAENNQEQQYIFHNHTITQHSTPNKLKFLSLSYISAD